MSDAQTVIGATAYPYADEILVEVTCEDGDGDLVVHSYGFAPGDGGAATPSEAVPERHRTVVTEALAEKGYEPDADLADTAR